MGRDVAGYPPDRVRTVLLDRVDLRGLPTVEQGGAAWVIPAFLPEDGARVLFPDEPIAAPPTVHATCYQLVLDRATGAAVGGKVGP
jgi:hypothetical protein